MAEKEINIVDEVEQRLEDLFGDDDDSDFEMESRDNEEPLVLEKDDTIVDDTPALDVEDTPVLDIENDDAEFNPLTELKSIVLSIEWEITDEIMTKFLTQLNELTETYKDDRVVVMFLQLLSSVGKYIKAKKANADPDVVKLLNTAYAGMEEVVLTKDITETDKKRILSAEINKFKKIKERLAKKQENKKSETVSRATKAGTDQAVGSPASETKEPKEQLVHKKSMGVASRLALMMFLPLLVVSAVIYLYSVPLTGMSSQIDQLIQNVAGISAQSTHNIVLGVLCGLVILIGLGAAFYGKRLAGRISELTQVVERLCAGDRGALIPADTGDEVGELSRALIRLRESIR